MQHLLKLYVFVYWYAASLKLWHTIVAIIDTFVVIGFALYSCQNILEC